MTENFHNILFSLHFLCIVQHLQFTVKTAYDTSESYYLCFRGSSHRREAMNRKLSQCPSSHQQQVLQDFSQLHPGGPVDESLPANAGDMGSIPWSGKIPHIAGQLNCAPQPRKPCPRPHAPQQEKPLPWEAHAPQLGSSPHSSQLEKTHPQQWRSSATIKRK